MRRLAVAVTVLGALVAPAAASAKSGPVITTFSSAFVYGLTHQNIDPAGANDYSCKPTAAHPRPVVLLHGTFANRFNSFASLANTIKQQGYCVFAPDYGRGLIKGINGTHAVKAEAREIAVDVSTVLSATGASQVDIVGYSQGGLVARAYLKYYGGANATNPALSIVHSLIGLSVDNEGTTLGGRTALIDRYRLRPLLRLIAGDSSVDQIAGSGFLTELNAGGQTVPGVNYTMVATKNDEINVPPTNAFLTPAPGQSVNDVMLQTGCPTDFSDHFNLPYSRRAAWIVLRALDPSYAAPEPCQVLLPGL
jgi:triacylglycerol esterase/lipase EstA (alpha/beta hydrolase family)